MCSFRLPGTILNVPMNRCGGLFQELAFNFLPNWQSEIAGSDYGSILSESEHFFRKKENAFVRL